MTYKPAFFLPLLVTVAVACTPAENPALDGPWRAAWESSGGEIPVNMFIRTDPDGEIRARVRNDTDIVEFDRVTRSGKRVDFFLDRYECVISAELSEDGSFMTGRWSKQTGTPNHMPFTARKGGFERFPVETYNPEPDEVLMKDVAGTWRLRFEGSPYDSMGIFRQKGDRVTGTIRAIDGDFSFLEGIYRNGLLMLSHFNGSWVFLFRAELDAEGVLNGYWARGPNPPVNWTAVKENHDYPDTWRLTKLSNDRRELRFSYPRADGTDEMMSSWEPPFKGGPFLAAFYTTGCPNSHDSAETLSRLSKEFAGRGLKMVFVYYELTDDKGLILERIRRFHEDYDLPHPALYSFAMSKNEIVQEIPDFRNFYAWPTVVFYDAEGKVADIHTGFDGPATGEYHDQLIHQYRQRIGELLPVSTAVKSIGHLQEEQDPTSDFDVDVENPAYERGQGPRILFDEGHFNWHTRAGRYKVFADILENDGYRIQVNTDVFKPEVLRGHDILVIANALNEKNSEKNWDPPHLSAFSQDEIDAVEKWVKGGGSLLLIADHEPWGGAAHDLAERFGVIMSRGRAFDLFEDDIYSKENGKLLDHPITRGRNPRERLNRVRSFRGQSLQVPKGSGFLQFSGDAYDVDPVTQDKRPVPGHFQGAGFGYGKGRVVVMGEAAMLSRQTMELKTRQGKTIPFASMGMSRDFADENKQLLLNIAHFLSGLLEPGTVVEPSPANSMGP